MKKYRGVKPRALVALSLGASAVDVRVNQRGRSASACRSWCGNWASGPSGVCRGWGMHSAAAAACLRGGLHRLRGLRVRRRGALFPPPRRGPPDATRPPWAATATARSWRGEFPRRSSPAALCLRTPPGSAWSSRPAHGWSTRALAVAADGPVRLAGRPPAPPPKSPGSATFRIRRASGVEHPSCGPLPTRHRVARRRR